MTEIPPKLKEYINNNRGSLPPITDPDEPLQLDSLGLIRLVAFLESDLGYRVKDEELMAENFATLRTIGELLATKTPTARTRQLKRPANESKLTAKMDIGPWHRRKRGQGTESN